MALDEAIAEAVAAGQQPPTLRFYAWEPACLSLGFAQPVADADLDRLRARGWEIVRRLTGGKAILHADELTYSIAAPEGDPRVAGGVVESYRRLSQGLLAGLAELGATVRADALRPDLKAAGPVCFEVPSDWEITVSGRKLVGSAQTRREGYVLQHGALPLQGDLGRICEALAFPDDGARGEAIERVRARATTLGDALAAAVSYAQGVQALVKGFSSALGLELIEEETSLAEMDRAEALLAERYAHPGWTFKR